MTSDITQAVEDDF